MTSSRFLLPIGAMLLLTTGARNQTVKDAHTATVSVDEAEIKGLYGLWAMAQAVAPTRFFSPTVLPVGILS